MSEPARHLSLVRREDPVGILDPAHHGDDFDPGTIAWVLDPGKIPALLEAIAGAEEIVIDLETTGLDERAEDALVVMAALTLPQRLDPGARPTTWVVPLAHPDSPLRGRWREHLRTIAEAISAARGGLTNQHLKFDCRWIFAATGVDLSGRLAWDTQVSSHLLDENASTRLKVRAPETFGVPPWDDFDLTRPGAALRVPLFTLGLYNARDTYWTWRLAVLHRTLLGVGESGLEDPETPDEIEHRRLGRFSAWCAMPMTATLTAVEQRGIGLDLRWTLARLAEVEEIAATARGLLVSRYPDLPPGEPSLAPTSLWFLAWTERAVAAGDLQVTAMTATGRPQWNKAVLLRQSREGSEAAALLLDYRRAVKAAEYLRSWLAHVDGRTSRVHTTYNVGRVVTGRLSSENPNMQQVTKTLRPAFVPAPGHVIADLDYSQIELRAAAFIARSDPMIAAFRRGDDLHLLLAANITGKRPEDVTPTERQAGKAGNFGFLFGMGAGGFMDYAETNYGVSFTEEQAQEVRRAFFDQWTGLDVWHARAVARAHHTGQVVNPLGRVRRLPMIHDGNPGLVSHAERQAINSPVQSFASDILGIAASSIEGTLPGHSPVPGARIVATVHDSIVVEVPADDWKRVTGRCMRRMIDVPPVLARLGCALDVPLAVEATVGSRWGMSDVGSIR